MRPARVEGQVAPGVFDWRRECPADLRRKFPPIVGPGRGYIMHPPE